MPPQCLLNACHRLANDHGASMFSSLVVPSRFANVCKKLFKSPPEMRALATALRKTATLYSKFDLLQPVDQMYQERYILKTKFDPPIEQQNISTLNYRRGPRTYRLPKGLFL